MGTPFKGPKTFNPNKAQELYFPDQHQQQQQPHGSYADPRQQELSRDLGLDDAPPGGYPQAVSDDSEDDDHYYQPSQQRKEMIELDKYMELEKQAKLIAGRKKAVDEKLSTEQRRKRQAIAAVQAAEDQMAKLRESSRQQLVLMKKERELIRSGRGGKAAAGAGAGAGGGGAEVAMLRRRVAELESALAAAAAGGARGAPAAPPGAGGVAEAEHLKGIVAEQDRLITDAEKEVDEYRSENNKMREKLGTLEVAIKASHAREKEMEDEAAALEDDLQNAMHRIAALEAKAGDGVESRRLDGMLQQASMDKAAMAERIAHLEGEVAADRRGARAIAGQLQAIQRAQAELRLEGQQLPLAAAALAVEMEPALQNAMRRAAAGLDEVVAKYRRECALRKKLHNELCDLKGSIRVLCRVRPLLQFEAERAGGGRDSPLVCGGGWGDDETIRVLPDGDVSKAEKTFEFDRVFQRSAQEEVFADTLPLVTSVMDGYNVCIFAYGQTGSGKTYTMEGTQSDPGVNTRALEELFRIREERAADWELGFRASLLEIYNETLVDLLDGGRDKKLEVRLGPNGVHVPGLAEVPVATMDDVWALIAKGRSNRSTFATNMNEHSSRSHSILCVQVEGTNRLSGATSRGKLNLVDLAGSERVGKSGATGDRLKEAQAINQSLSSLGDVIASLVSKSSHVPYRNSKLTYLLQDSLGGNSKTLMFVNLSPAADNLGESLCSLNFASRVRNVDLGQAKKMGEASPKR